MATSGEAFGNFNGRPRFRLRTAIALSQVDAANNRARWNWSTRVENLDGSSITWAGGSFPFSISVNDTVVASGNTPDGVFDFRDGAAYHEWITGTTGWITYNSDGRKTISFSGAVANASIFGSANNSGSVVADRIPKRPSKPAAPVLGTPTTTSIPFTISAPSDNGGAAISTYNLQAATNSSFGTIVRSWNSGSTSQSASPLNPGTQHWIRYRAVNSVGASDWSDSRSATTLPAVPPGMTVTPGISGTSATVALTAPSGVSTVTSYRVERRPVGGSAVVYNSPTSPITVPSLTPGSVNEWRASAFIGTYQTPWTAWTTVSQPQPNTSPGDYFDGSTPDKTDIDYQWASTVNNSLSRAVAKTPLGWRTFAAGAAASGGAGVVARATGGRSGAFGARVTFFADTTAAGFRAGTAPLAVGAVEVAEGGLYWGTIYVAPSKSQRMVAEITWLDSLYAEVGTPALGDPVIVDAGPTPMVRLVVQGVAPAGAVRAAVGWRDVAGTGWSAWQGGDSVMMDDAMVSIGELYEWFSGDTPDSATFAYEWLGSPNASVSMATALDPEDSDPLADPDCPPIPSAPRPPAISDDCLDDVGSWRRYWAIISQDQITDWLDLVPTVAITTGALPARQVRIRVYPNPEGLAPADFPATEWAYEQIISFIPASTVLTIDGVAQRVWAEVAGGEAISADRLLYGTGGGPASWPILSCGTGYLVSFDVPLDAPEGNLSIDIALTTRML